MRVKTPRLAAQSFARLPHGPLACPTVRSLVHKTPRAHETSLTRAPNENTKQVSVLFVDQVSRPLPMHCFTTLSHPPSTHTFAHPDAPSTCPLTLTCALPPSLSLDFLIHIFARNISIARYKTRYKTQDKTTTRHNKTRLQQDTRPTAHLD